MLRIKEEKGKFTCFFKGREIFTHTATEPCVEVGKGNGKIKKNKKHYGYYTVKEKNLKMQGLSDFQVQRCGESIATILLGGVVELDFKVESNRLVIYINLKNYEENVDYNRFSIRLTGNKGEKIYGCGEQFSILNLKGKKIPLLTREPGLGRDNSI
ncbi:MAG: hypothetical protein ACOC4M_08215, partial [Promethearchaeia archaeon]